jgi:cytochrome c-type biogenesis protein CcmH
MGCAQPFWEDFMMGGWIVMILLAALTFAGLLYFASNRKQLWTAIAATIVLALAGYTVQGKPSLADAPAQTAKKGSREFEALIAMRADMDYKFANSKQWLTMSDSFARSGNFRLSVALLQSGLRKNPNNGDLWAGLGLIMMLAGDGNMSPAASYAFAKTRALSPEHPAPDYFDGLNALFSGDVGKTLKLWESLLERAPKNAKWRPKLESQLSGLKALLSKDGRTDTMPNQNTEIQR